MKLHYQFIFLYYYRKNNKTNRSIFIR